MKPSYSIIFFVVGLVIGVMLFMRGVGDNVTTVFIFIMYTILGAGFVRLYFEIRS